MADRFRSLRLPQEGQRFGRRAEAMVRSARARSIKPGQSASTWAMCRASNTLWSICVCTCRKNGPTRKNVARKLACRKKFVSNTARAGPGRCCVEKGALLLHTWIAGDDEMGRSSTCELQVLEMWRHSLAVPSNTLIRDGEVAAPPYSWSRPTDRSSFPTVDRWDLLLPAKPPGKRSKFASGVVDHADREATRGRPPRTPNGPGRNLGGDARAANGREFQARLLPL